MNFEGFVNAGLQLGLESLIIKPKRGIFDSVTLSPLFVPQATIEERHMDEMEITEHPVEQGANIADHAFKRPAELVLKCGWSNSPSSSGSLMDAAVAYFSAEFTGVRQVVNVVEEVASVLGIGSTILSSVSGSDQEQINGIYADLLGLQQSRVLVDIYTGRRSYTSMLLKSIAVENDYKTENALFATLIFRQLILVNTQSVILEKAKQAQPAATTPPVVQGAKQLKTNPPNILNVPNVTNIPNTATSIVAGQF